MMREYLFEANNADGNSEKDGVIAIDVGDARSQLARMGYRDIRIITDDLQGMRRPANFEEPLPALYIEAAYDTLPLAVLKIFKGNWLYWLPGAGILAEALWSGRAPYLGAAALAAGLVATALLALPVVIYQQILWARVRGRYALGLAYVSFLQRSKMSKGITPMALAGERAIMLAGLGRLDEAVAEYSAHEGKRDRIMYLTGLGSIHDAAGERGKMIEFQRQLLVESKDSKEVRIDLAWSLMRYTDQHEEARTLVSGIHAQSCAEIYGFGLRIVRALISQVDNRHDIAVTELRKVHDELTRYNNPLIIGVRAELRAYMALSLKSLGRKSEADAMWQEVLPLLRVQRVDLLIRRYEQCA
ncbi:MAG: hypothetical protein V4857_10885 [Pseudomonadota bacterium]